MATKRLDPRIGGLFPEQRMALGHLAEWPGGRREALVASPRLVKILLNKGWVRTEPGRPGARILHITDAGMTALRGPSSARDRRASTAARSARDRGALPSGPLGHDRWWVEVQRRKDEMGAARFEAAVRHELRAPSDLRSVIERLAWNDRNSEWALNRAHILKTMTFWDGYDYVEDDREPSGEREVDRQGDPVTPGDVVDSLMQMLD